VWLEGASQVSELSDRPQFAEFGRQVRVIARHRIHVRAATRANIGREAIDQQCQAFIAIGGHECVLASTRRRHSNSVFSNRISPFSSALS
jgi:hypothetical protein